MARSRRYVLTCRLVRNEILIINTGSKINIIWDSAEMLRDLLVLRANYVFGRWKVTRVEEAVKPSGGSNGNGHVTAVIDGQPRRRTKQASEK